MGSCNSTPAATSESKSNDAPITTAAAEEQEEQQPPQPKTMSVGSDSEQPKSSSRPGAMPNSSDEKGWALPKSAIREIEKFTKAPPAGVKLLSISENQRSIKVMIVGPQESRFAGKEYEIDIYLPDDYPLVPPKFTFITKIQHPNVSGVGRIGLGALKDKWSPPVGIAGVCKGILEMLINPNSYVENPLAQAEWK